MWARVDVLDCLRVVYRSKCNPFFSELAFKSVSGRDIILSERLRADDGLTFVHHRAKVILHHQSRYSIIWPPSSYLMATSLSFLAALITPPLADPLCYCNECVCSHTSGAQVARFPFLEVTWYGNHFINRPGTRIVFFSSLTTCLWAVPDTWSYFRTV